MNKQRVIDLLLAVVAGAFVCCALLGVHACTGTPDERAVKVAKAETELCKLRSFEVLAEAAIPGGAPAPDSTRGRIEAAEDAFCAARAAANDGGVTK